MKYLRDWNKRGTIDPCPYPCGPYSVETNIMKKAQDAMKTIMKRPATLRGVYKHWDALGLENIPTSFGVVTQQATALQDEWESFTLDEQHDQFYRYRERVQVSYFFTVRVKDQQHYSAVKDNYAMSCCELEWGKTPVNSIEHAIRKVVNGPCLCFGKPDPKPQEKPKEPILESEEIKDAKERMEKVRNLIRNNRKIKQKAVELMAQLNAREENFVHKSFSKDQIAELVSNSNLYQSIKRALKYKCYREGDLELLQGLATYCLEMTCRQAELDPRDMNLNIFGNTSGSGKTRLIEALSGLIAGKYKQYLATYVANTPQGLDGYTKSDLQRYSFFYRF